MLAKCSQNDGNGSKCTCFSAAAAAAAKSLQSCPTLCDPMDCSLPVSSAHGIFQARVLEWIATAFSCSLREVVQSYAPPLGVKTSQLKEDVN